ncbi:glutamine ABC transporter permease GlnP [Acidocella aquatica]|uniref:Glutamine ABC transporter permease GlnP n=1 Tax=Acidocella aquatica TaxID=1922313 RepID=A0ABQ6A4C9_9PROT|nr:glutamine ABC transporter permease GlnP [Acidocella aquatica]GLR66527.1 glutamine ABC transporter permease GlnP [Acidocella aquatica]
MSFDWSAVIAAFPQLLQGAELTVFIAGIGLIAGISVGVLLGMVRAFGPAPVNAAALVYVAFIRGTPLIVQIMFIYFALPILMHIRIQAVPAGIIAIAVNSSAYVAEIVRGSLLSISKGLTEAGLAMGLPFWKVLVFITGPLAFRRLIPPLGNQCITSLKDTSLLLVIGVSELTFTGQEIIADNFRAVEIWSAVAVIYFVMLSAVGLFWQYVERRMPIL